ncbi:LytTR family DNA-binding domain-containing protein [Frateuria hangzhouensis]|uniref:LytTR family DNA-binding domain-containing protein n=1 Tax=Frateuria hangzhouensis TaxID=2995589 RepID=UPI002260E33D|nr:LytTR family DNA-binding domain-containing protein [Frateuria sp. STR12]MCX7512768.1 LytTR family DNA-binding domain-containing protein [Frateuria sp. STR12]
MTPPPVPDFFQRWRRPIEVGAWIGFFVLNALFNSFNSTVDHPDVAAWEPWVWEWTSALVMLCLLPAVIALERRWPIRFDTWRRNLPLHALASVPFSLIHVGAMGGLRRLVYLALGGHYEQGPWWFDFGYEYVKDVRSYFVIVGALVLYRLWRLRQRGEARLLAAPDEGPPVEPVERPERFLVRKLGKEFLVSAREIEWLQAAGNYVNLHVRGRDYPLRTTMAAIEERLDPGRFVRVHRSYFVNLDYLSEIEPLDTGDARLKLRDGAIVPCSRRYRAQLRERFGEAAPA